MRAPSRIIAISLLALTAACGSDSGVNPQLAEVAGTYSLVKINDHEIPAIVGGSWVLELTLTLTDEGRLILIGFTYPVSNGSSGPAPPPTFRQSLHFDGSFTRVGNTISLYPSAHTSFLELGTAPFAANDTLVVTANAGNNINPIWYTYTYVRETSQ